MRPDLPLCLLLGTSPLLAQDPSSPGHEKELCRIEGRTVNALTGVPVGGVSLTLRALGPGSRSRIEISDAAGRFSLTGVTPGSYMLSASQAEPPSAGTATLNVSAGQVVSGIVLRLTPVGVISGTVVDDEGRRMRRAFVTILRVGVGSLTSATTDVNGDSGFQASDQAATCSSLHPPSRPHQRSSRSRKSVC
jgi:hypothetical protein